MVPEDWRIQHFCIIRLSFGFPFRHCKSSIGTESRYERKEGLYHNGTSHVIQCWLQLHKGKNFG